MFKAVEVFFILAAVVGGPLLAVMLVPALVKRFVGTRERTVSRQAELDDLRERVAELDGLSRRVTELEERVDFAERLLAQQRDAALPRPRS